MTSHHRLIHMTQVSRVNASSTVLLLNSLSSLLFSCIDFASLNSFRSNRIDTCTHMFPTALTQNLICAGGPASIYSATLLLLSFVAFHPWPSLLRAGMQPPIFGPRCSELAAGHRHRGTFYVGISHPVKNLPEGHRNRGTFYVGISQPLNNLYKGHRNRTETVQKPFAGFG